MAENTKTIYWVRHGPTHAKEMIGWTDLPADLSDSAALSRLRAALPAGLPIVSSDLTRTIQTAEALARAGPHTARRTDAAHRLRGLREIHFGAWEGRRHADIEAEDPDRIRAFWDQPGDIAPPGGESWNMLATRVEAAVQELLASHGELIVVAHFGVILSQVQRAKGWTTLEAFGQRIEPLSLTQITYGPERHAPRVNHLS